MERGGTEDKLIESTISMADYCLSHHMPCDVYFCEKKEIEKVSARTPQDFDMFLCPVWADDVYCGKRGGGTDRLHLGA